MKTYKAPWGKSLIVVSVLLSPDDPEDFVNELMS